MLESLTHLTRKESWKRASTFLDAAKRRTAFIIFSASGEIGETFDPIHLGIFETKVLENSMTTLLIFIYLVFITVIKRGYILKAKQQKKPEYML